MRKYTRPTLGLYLLRATYTGIQSGYVTNSDANLEDCKLVL